MFLVATNEMLFRTNLKKELTQLGDVCVEAETGEEALAQVNQSRPDIILLDLYLQEHGGIEVLRSLRAQGYFGKIIVLAGPSVQTMTSEASHLGAIQIVGRPLDVRQVLGAIRVASGDLNTEP